MGAELCLILHRKSANEPAIKEAVKYARGKGVDLDVRIPWNKKAKPKDDLKQCLEPYEGRLVIPGQAPIEGKMLLMAVGNSRLAGGGFEVAPKAELDDGLLDLAVVAHATGGDLMRLSQELETPDDPSKKVLRYGQLPEFTIEAQREVHFNLDGEPTTETKLHFSVLPKHLGVAY